MTDEVTRLRRLRKTALKVRALASSLSVGGQDAGVYERAALLNWRIARIATGRLRSHPYESYQKDQGTLESGVDRCIAYLKAKVAMIRGSGMRVFLDEAAVASRELDDTRALTLSADLSDALGRVQQCMRDLIEEARAHAAVRADQKSLRGVQASRSVAASPYIAL